MYATEQQRQELHASFGFTPFSLDLEKVFQMEYERNKLIDASRPKRQVQEQARQEKRRGKIDVAEFYWKQVFQFPSKHIPADSISGFEESVIEAGKQRALKWFNG